MAGPEAVHEQEEALAQALAAKALQQTFAVFADGYPEGADGSAKVVAQPSILEVDDLAVASVGIPSGYVHHNTGAPQTGG